MEESVRHLRAAPSDAGVRLDSWLTRVLHDLSRVRVQALIRAGHVAVTGHRVSAHMRVSPGMEVTVRIPPPAAVPALVPQAIPLHIVYEDEDVIAIDKQAGLVVHPAPGHAADTLVNALLHHCPDLPGIGGERRPGIVHRLDRDTSGIMIVARNETSMRDLVRQFKNRQVRKEYLALVAGRPRPSEGRIETLIGRHPHHRQKMSARPARGRSAVTEYATVEAFADAALLRIRLETGRTHQIRVHMSHIGHPVLGDRQYGRKTAAGGTPAPRQMLHATRLVLTHPRTRRPLAFEVALPADMAELLRALRTERADRGQDRTAAAPPRAGGKAS